MFKKTCQSCGKNSYSSNSSIKWVCPYCQQDISHLEAEIAQGPPQKPGNEQKTSSKDVG